MGDTAPVEHYWAEYVPRSVDLTALLNERWRGGWRLEHVTSVSWSALFANSSTQLVLVWVPRTGVPGPA
jgi:hypothetical protein